mgnify:FL=1
MKNIIQTRQLDRNYLKGVKMGAIGSVLLLAVWVAGLLIMFLVALLNPNAFKDAKLWELSICVVLIPIATIMLACDAVKEVLLLAKLTKTLQQTATKINCS